MPANQKYLKQLTNLLEAKEPMIRMSTPLFLMNSAVSGMMIGTGLGQSLVNSPWWILLTFVGLALNVYGFHLRAQTRQIEAREMMEELLKNNKSISYK
jgi:hypothetical protein